MLLSSTHADNFVTTDECKKPLAILDYNQRKGASICLTKIYKNFYADEVRWPLLFFYNMVDAAANNAYILMKKFGRYSKSKKCFLKNLSFQLAKSAVENRLRLPKQMCSARDAAAQVVFSILTESNVTPHSTVSSHQERCRVCQKQARSRCRPGARIAWLRGHKQILGEYKKFTASNSRDWTKKQRSLLRIFTNSGVNTKKERKKRSSFKKILEIYDFWGEITKKRIFIAKSAKKQFSLNNSWMTTSILGASGLELHSNCTEPVTFFRTQSSLGGGVHNFRLVGHKWWFEGHGPEMPPYRTGPVTIWWLWQRYVSTRGGVEDTRLEAKAKDTKKIQGQGQGQPFRGQTLSRPRTGMLEAKDQGHKRKKKGLHKNFSSDLHKKTFSKKFFKRSTKF